MFKKKKTMKKIYQNPTIKIVKVELQRMMQSSDLRYDKTTSETSGNLSRKGSFWDDEDDEDYDY